MKLAITSETADRNGKCTKKFGKAPYFLVFDTESGEFEAVENKAGTGEGCRGQSVADFIMGSGFDALATGKMRVDIHTLLTSNGMEIFDCDGMKAEDILSGYKASTLRKLVPRGLDEGHEHDHEHGDDDGFIGHHGHGHISHEGQQKGAELWNACTSKGLRYMKK
jgi:predicted Fe-Mo cluster-binding NifX family protein